MQGADNNRKKKGLRPDTISDIISALCMPLNNDSISTRAVFIHFLCTMNLRKKQHFSVLFLDSGELQGRLQEQREDDMCLRGPLCARLDHPGVRSLRGQVDFQEIGPPHHPRRAVRRLLLNGITKPHPCHVITVNTAPPTATANPQSRTGTKSVLAPLAWEFCCGGGGGGVISACTKQPAGAFGCSKKNILP